MTKARPLQTKRATVEIRAQFSILVWQALLGATVITILAFAGSIFAGALLDVFQGVKLFGISTLAIVLIGFWISLEKFRCSQLVKFEMGPRRRVNHDS